MRQRSWRRGDLPKSSAARTQTIQVALNMEGVPPGPRQSAGMSGSWAGDAKEDEGSVPSQALRRKAAAMLRAPWRRKIAMARGCAGWP
jgi:hypothetical protein